MWYYFTDMRSHLMTEAEREYYVTELCEGIQFWRKLRTENYERISGPMYRVAQVVRSIKYDVYQYEDEKMFHF